MSSSTSPASASQISSSSSTSSPSSAQFLHLPHPPNTPRPMEISPRTKRIMERSSVSSATNTASSLSSSSLPSASSSISTLSSLASTEMKSPHTSSSLSSSRASSKDDEKAKKPEELLNKLRARGLDEGTIFESSTELSETIFSPQGDAYRQIANGISLAGEDSTEARLLRIETFLEIPQGRLRVYVDAIAEFRRRTAEVGANRQAILDEISSRLGLTSEQFENLMKPAN